jgi:AcrR family transcriptional regulator
MADRSLSTSSFLSPSEIDELLDTVAAWTQHLFHRMADAFMSADGDAPLALHRALAAMLREIADTPEIVRLATVELPSLGPLLHAHRDRALNLFSTFLDVGLDELPAPARDREAISLCIAGGLWETVRRYALERRLNQLPGTLPGMSYFCVSTFFGIDEALRVSAAPGTTTTTVGTAEGGPLRGPPTVFN